MKKPTSMSYESKKSSSRKKTLALEQPTALDKKVGQNIKLIREATHIPAEKFCDITDITLEQLRAYEAGEVAIPASDLYTFALVLGVPVETFFF